MHTDASPTSKEKPTSSKATTPDFSKYTPDTPFPKRLVKALMKKQYMKFMEVLK